MTNTTTATTITPPSPPIRCLGPFQISPTIYLTPIYISDAPEQHRILNLNDSFFKGLYSDSMTFPFPKEEALRFSIYQEQNESSRASDHREMGHCYHGKELVLNGASTTTPTMKGNDDDETPLSCGGVGYWLSPEHAGKGIMTDVLKNLDMTVSMENVGLTTLEAPE
ncbi:hypothetical protein BKA57DRAFT_540337 [Linnemannia elongata]|nr:hypothetical protein BKA57DRAFT_540337 [Linnemannia elongata]